MSASSADITCGRPSVQLSTAESQPLTVNYVSALAACDYELYESSLELFDAR